MAVWGCFFSECGNTVIVIGTDPCPWSIKPYKSSMHSLSIAALHADGAQATVTCSLPCTHAFITLMLALCEHYQTMTAPTGLHMMCSCQKLLVASMTIESGPSICEHSPGTQRLTCHTTSQDCNRFSSSLWSSLWLETMQSARLFSLSQTSSLGFAAGTISWNFITPVVREFCLMHGMCDVSRNTMVELLSSPGRALMVAIGGASEALLAAPGTMDLILNKR